MAKAKMAYSEIQNWEEGEIDSHVKKLRRELFEIKMEKMTRGIKNSQDFSVLKKNVARLLTAKNWKRYERS